METPRVVILTRPTEYEEVVQRHGTAGQAEFYLRERGQALSDLRTRHEEFAKVRKNVLRQIPSTWRHAQVMRMDLDQFLFSPKDIVIALGQDGLVANVAKYLDEQVVIGINPGWYDGVLTKNKAEDTAALLADAFQDKGNYEERTMAHAKLDDGQELFALNEIFVGHKSHQSARYEISYQKAKEYQSSSGVVITTGTGATGWGQSIHKAHKSALLMPKPWDRKLAFFVREAFPSSWTGTKLTEGLFGASSQFGVKSQMDMGGVIFGDGIEQDYLPFGFGQKLDVSVAKKRLILMVG